MNSALAATSIAELVALAKAKPGQLNFGSPGSGTSAHLATEMFRSMTGINIVHVPYQLKALQTADFRERLAHTGADALGTTPQDYASHIRTQIEKMRVTIKVSGARPD